MSFDDAERSVAGGAPLEYFQFNRDTIYYRYTTADTDRIFQGFPYTALAGLQRGPLQQSSSDTSTQLQVTMPRTASIAVEFIGSRSPAPVDLIVFRLHEGLDDGEAKPIWVGEVANATFDGSSMTLTCSSDQQAYGNQLGRAHYQRTCWYMLYDEFCKLNPTDHTFDATVVSASGDLLTIMLSGPGDLGATPSWYRAGVMIAGADRSFILDEPTSGVFSIQTPLQLTVGQVIQIQHGCMRDVPACQRLVNITRFGGYQLMPQSNPWTAGIR